MHDIARVLAAGSRHSVREGRVVLHSLPIGFSLDGAQASAIRAACSASRFGVDMHVVTADLGRVPQPDAGGRALPSRRRGHGRDALCGRPLGARRRRGRPRRRRGRHGGGTTTRRGVRRRPLRACRRLRARRPPRDHGHRARPFDRALQTPSESRRSTAVCWPAAPTSAT